MCDLTWFADKQRIGLGSNSVGQLIMPRPGHNDPGIYSCWKIWCNRSSFDNRYIYRCQAIVWYCFKPRICIQLSSRYYGTMDSWWRHGLEMLSTWTSYQISKIACCASAWNVFSGNPGNVFPAIAGIRDPDMHHGTCVTYVPWYMPGSLTSDFLWSRWRGKRSQHSRHMRNTQFCVSGKRSIAGLLWHKTAVTGGSPYSLQTTV